MDGPSQAETLQRIQSALEAASHVFTRFTPGAIGAEYKAGHDPVTEADKSVDSVLRKQLLREGEGWLSEESVDDLSRLDKKRVWIVDPLDGTREYGEGRSDWAVHIALSIDGEPVVGAVALPGLPLTLNSAHAPHPPSAKGKPRMLVSRTRPALEALAVAQRLGADLVAMGSAGAKAMAVLRGEAEIYLHSGGQYEWDSCAPVAVARAAGLHASRIDGSACLYNRKNPYMPDLLICLPEYAQTVINTLKENPPWMT